jgi:hypothetical protein
VHGKRGKKNHKEKRVKKIPKDMTRRGGSKYLIIKRNKNNAEESSIGGLYSRLTKSYKMRGELNFFFH